MKLLIAIILAIALIFTFSAEAYAGKPPKPDKPDKVTIINEGDTYEGDTIVQTLGTQGDLNTWLYAREAYEWVIGTGVFLPRIIAWQMIKIGELQVRLGEAKDRIAELEKRIEILEAR